MIVLYYTIKIILIQEWLKSTHNLFNSNGALSTCHLNFNRHISLLICIVLYQTIKNYWKKVTNPDWRQWTSLAGFWRWLEDLSTPPSRVWLSGKQARFFNACRSMNQKLLPFILCMETIVLCFLLDIDLVRLVGKRGWPTAQGHTFSYSDVLVVVVLWAWEKRDASFCCVFVAGSTYGSVDRCVDGDRSGDCGKCVGTGAEP